MLYLIYFAYIASNFLLCFISVKAISVFLQYEISVKKTTMIFFLAITAALSIITTLPSQKIPAIIRGALLITAILGKILFFSLIFKKRNLKIVYICFLSIVTSSYYGTLITPLIPNKILMSIVCYVLESLVLTLIIFYIKRKNFAPVLIGYFDMIPKKLYVIILLFLYVMNLFTYAAITPGYQVVALVMMLPSLIFITVIVFWVMKISISERENRQMSHMLSKQLKVQIGYYEKINSIYSEFRSFRHDFKNHLICLRSLLSENEVEKAVEYMNDIENMSAYAEKKSFDTGNVIADALLNDKNEKAQSINSHIVFNGYVPTNGITNSDLCTIMANALDNAIEACAKDKSGQTHTITVKSDFKQGYFFFKAENPVFEKVNIKNGNEIKTTKSDKELHGFGVANIIKTSKKYNGDTRTTVKDNKFILEVELLLSREL